jgi:hypothetical protein
VSQMLKDGNLSTKYVFLKTNIYLLHVSSSSHPLCIQFSINCNSTYYHAYEDLTDHVQYSQERAQLRHGILSVVGAACSRSNVDLALLFQEIDAVFTAHSPIPQVPGRNMGLPTPSDGSMPQSTTLVGLPLMTAQNGHTAPYTPIVNASSSSHFLQRNLQMGPAVPDNNERNDVPSSNVPRPAVSMSMVESGNGLLGHATFQTPQEPLNDHSQWQPEDFGVLASFDYYDVSR